MTSKDPSYEGWSNEATFSAMFWVNNDPALHRDVEDAIRELPSERITPTFARELFETLETAPSSSRTPRLRSVNWNEIAEELRTDKAEQTRDEATP